LGTLFLIFFLFLLLPPFTATVIWNISQKVKNVDYIALLVDFASIDDDGIYFELFSKKQNKLTTYIVDFASTDDDIDFELFSKNEKC
jgi:hypothetical protein